MILCKTSISGCFWQDKSPSKVEAYMHWVIPRWILMNRPFQLLAGHFHLLTMIILFLVLDLEMVTICHGTYHIDNMAFCLKKIFIICLNWYSLCDLFCITVTTHDQNVFSFLPDQRACNGFEEVLSRYKQIVPHLRLAGMYMVINCHYLNFNLK
mgnify:CR=1 FL=1